MASKNLHTQIIIGGVISGAFKSAIGQARSGLGSIGSSIATLKDRQKELNRTIADQERLGRAGSALRVGYAQQELAVIGKQITALKQREALLAKGAQQRADGKSMMASGGLMIGGALAAAATLGKPVREAAALEHSLQLIGNTANMTGVQIGALKNQIFAVSKASNKSVNDVTGGIGFLIAAGMDVKTAAASIGTIAKASTASGASVEDLAKAAFTLGDSLNIDPANLNAALNIMAKAGKMGNVELKDMAKQLPVLGAGFKALGMEGPEATATIGAALQIARKGATDADEAANNAKNFVAKIMSPETLKKAQKHFGVDLYKIIKDAQTKGKNPFEASMEAIIKMTKGDQKAIGELFGDMQVQNFVRPMIDKWDEYRRIKRESMEGDDELAKDFAKMMDTMKEKTNGLGNAWTRLMVTMGDTYAPVIGDLTKDLSGMVEEVKDFTKENPGMASSIMSTTGVVIGLTAALGIGRLAAGGFMYAWGAIPPVLAASRAAIGATALAMRGLTAAMATNPIGLALLAGGLVYSTLDTVNKHPEASNDLSGAYDAMGNPNGLMPMPSMRGTGDNVSNVDNSTVNLSINTQPGQDSKAIAKAVMQELDKQRGIQRRSVMFDLAAGH